MTTLVAASILAALALEGWASGIGSYSDIGLQGQMRALAAQNTPESTGSVGAPTLTKGRWVLVHLFGEPVRIASGPAPYVRFYEDGRMEGFAGCNTVQGRYRRAGDVLQFSKLGTTRKLCPEGMEVERQLLKVLEATRRWAGTDRQLDLKDEQDTVLASFESKP